MEVKKAQVGRLAIPQFFSMEPSHVRRYDNNPIDRSIECCPGDRGLASNSRSPSPPIPGSLSAADYLSSGSAAIVQVLDRGCHGWSKGRMHASSRYPCPFFSPSMVYPPLNLPRRARYLVCFPSRFHLPSHSGFLGTRKLTSRCACVRMVTQVGSSSINAKIRSGENGVCLVSFH